MGEAKRRKAILGERYGASETSKRELHRRGLKKLMPDYGTHYLRTFGTTPLNAWIANPQVITGGTEANINWNANGYLATLIVTPEFAEAYKRNPSQVLEIVPDPDDAYVTPLGERVVPFKLVESSHVANDTDSSDPLAEKPSVLVVEETSEGK
jgi:hypothetical protein